MDLGLRSSTFTAGRVTRQRPEVLLVDDDGSVRTSIGRLLKSAGLAVKTYESAEALLLESDMDLASCILLDVRLPGLDGIGLQEELVGHGCHIPIIFLSGYASTSMVVRAMKHGANYFLEKPIDGDELLALVREAIKEREDKRQDDEIIQSIEARIAQLTPREMEVLEQVVLGRLNKQIAAHLDICEKTVKVHRAHGLQKLGVRSVADLVRLDEKCQIRIASSSLNQAYG